MPEDLFGCFANANGLRLHVDANRITLDSGDSEKVTVFHRKTGDIGLSLERRALSIVTGESGSEHFRFDGKPRFVLRFDPNDKSLVMPSIAGEDLVMFKSVCAAMAAPTE